MGWVGVELWKKISFKRFKIMDGKIKKFEYKRFFANLKDRKYFTIGAKVNEILCQLPLKFCKNFNDCWKNIDESAQF